MILSKGAGNCIFRCDSFHTWVALQCFSISFQQWHTRTSHGDGHVALRVGMTTPDTRAGTAQDDGGHVHWGASEAVTFLPVRPGQASLTQTISLREVSGVPRWLMGDSWINNGKKKKIIFLAAKQARHQILYDWFGEHTTELNIIY